MCLWLCCMLLQRSHGCCPGSTECTYAGTFVSNCDDVKVWTCPRQADFTIINATNDRQQILNWPPVACSLLEYEHWIAWLLYVEVFFLLFQTNTVSLCQ